MRYAVAESQDEVQTFIKLAAAYRRAALRYFEDGLEAEVFYCLLMEQDYLDRAHEVR